MDEQGFQFSIRRLLAVTALFAIGLAIVVGLPERGHTHVALMLVLHIAFGASIGTILRQPVLGSVWDVLAFLVYALLLAHW